MVTVPFLLLALVSLATPAVVLHPAAVFAPAAAAAFAPAAAAVFAPAAVAEPLQLTLPPAVYAVPGVPVHLYHDNLVLTQTPEDFVFQYESPVGLLEERCWTFTPAAGQTGEFPLTVRVCNSSGRVLESARTVVRVVPADAGAGRPLRLLMVGDSLTHASAYPNEIVRLLSQPGGPALTLLGTHHPASAMPGVVHEGYGGWRWSDFLTRFSPEPAPPAAGTAPRRTTSPFVFADAEGRGQLDLQRYFAEHCEGRAPDVVTFLLGINDCFGANPDDPVAMDAKINAVLDEADQLLAAFHKAAPEAALAVGLTTPPNARESGFEANYKGRYHRWGWKRIQHRLVQRMLERLGGREAEGIYLVPTQVNLDPVDGYPVDNGVHPNAAGYAQIGASFHAWLRAWMAGAL